MLANFSNLITFSRGSNATLTDASGRLTYAPSNLVPNSQDFEATTWVKSNVAVTANALTAPDGSITADTLTENSANGDHSVARLAALTQTSLLSIYAKAGTRNVLALGESSNGTYAKFDLSSGVVLSTGTGQISAGAITPAGDGWYRCSCLYTHGGVNRSLGISLCDASGNVSYAGNGTGNLYLWGAQLEAVTYQTTPSPYVSTSVANLLGFSEAFDNAAWTKTNTAVVTAAAQNPINNLWNAQKLMENTANAAHYVEQLIVTTAATSTLSVYAKASERNWVRLFMGSAGNAYFDLSNGVVGTVSAGMTASISGPTSNGFYRCTLTGTPTAASNAMRVYTANADNSATYTGDGNSGIYIYGAQLSNSGSLDPYVPTPGAAPSSTAYYGPRYDYDPVTLAAKGILIEEARTNLLTYSEQFDNAAWTRGFTNISANVALAPDGTVTGDKIVETTDPSVTHFVQGGGAVTSGSQYAVSCYAKSAGENRRLTVGGAGIGAANEYPIFDLDAGTVDIAGTTVVVKSATITPVGNGWYRCVVNVTAGGTAAIQFILTTATTDNSAAAQAYTGNGTSGLFLWGAQLEAGAFATSYIPTVASQVTRNADVAQITGSLFSQWYRQDEGTLVAIATAPNTPQTSAFARVVSANDGSINEYIDISRNSGRARGFVNDSAVSQASIDASAWSDATTAKLAFAYQLNNFAMSGNGNAAVADTSGTVPSPLQLTIGAAYSASSIFNGHIQNITYYPNRLPNDQLQAITK